MDVSSQRRMAAEILKVGENRVYLDSDRLEDIASAITREDVRDLIQEGVIAAKSEKGTSRGKAREKKKQKKKGRKKGHGSRKGSKGARNPKKKEWMEKIRAVRAELKKLKEEGKIENKVYRELYRKSKGGFFDSRRNVREYVENMK